MQINGMRVKDARKPLRLVVTKNNIRTGNNKNPSSCVAAKALCELPEVEEARVHVSRTYIKMKGADHWLRFNTGRPLRTEMVAFDRGGAFEPGDYQIGPVNSRELEYRGRSVNPNKKGGAREKGSKDRTPKFKRAKRHELSNVRARGANR